MAKSARAKRMEKHHKRNMGKGTLKLVSLMEIFTILVFFLLVNSADVQTLPNAKDMKLPESVAEKKPEETVTILIGRTEILVQGHRTIGYCAAPLKMTLQGEKSRLWATRTFRIAC
jgi:hypothetical protein